MFIISSFTGDTSSLTSSVGAAWAGSSTGAGTGLDSGGGEGDGDAYFGERADGGTTAADSGYLAYDGAGVGASVCLGASDTVLFS